MFSKYTSNYFFKQDNGRFGSQQQDYLQKVTEIVAATREQIKNTVEGGCDLEALFHELLSSLGQVRYNIAMQHSSSNKEMYGILRHLTPKHFVMHTGLFNVYQKYNDTLLPRLQRYLHQMKHTLTDFQQRELKISGKPCMGRKNAMEISILTGPEHFSVYTREEYDRICTLASLTPLDSTHSVGECFNHLLEKEVMQVIKQKSMSDYKKLKLGFVVKDLYEQFGGRKSDWVLVTNRCEIDGKMYALTQYVTWMYRTFRDDPVTLMTTRQDPTIISLIHQDVFLIQDTLNDIAKLFKSAIECSSEDKDNLINQVGLINYLFAHAMPYQRGSAAICEWIEMAIYAYHGFDLKYNENYSVNMEALTLPLDEFISKYPSMIQLEVTPRNALEL